jgi:hypothetical protein
MSDTKKTIYIASENPEPNIVDSYSSYTYNITFSMLPQSFWYAGVLPIGDLSKNKIIIAKTGVTTKFNIDNLQILTANDNYGATFTSSSSITTKATFEITEPLGSSLVSLMTRGWNELRNMDIRNDNKSKDLYDSKNKTGPLDLMYLLEVDLIGHRGTDAQDELFEVDHDLLGTGKAGTSNGTEIFGKYVYPVYLTQFDFKPDHEGTRYNFEVVSKDNFAKGLPSETRMVVNEVKLKGANVDAMFSQLSNAVNQNIVSSTSGLTSGGRPDKDRCHKIEIKLGEMYGKDSEGENIVIEGEGDWASKVQALSDAKETTPTATEPNDVTADSQEETPTEKLTEIEIAEATKIDDAIMAILSRSINYINLVTPQKKFDPKNGNKSSKKPVLKPTYSAKVERSIIANGKIAHTGGPAYTITYVIDMHLQAGGQVDETETETTQTQKDIVDQWAIIKQYDYMFTGENDQVMDVDISFPRGQTFLFPEHGGIKPTYHDTPASTQTGDENSVANEKRLDQLKQSIDPDLFLDHFRQLQTELQSALSTIKQDGIDFLEGIAVQVKGAESLKLANGRLPSSPAGVFAKIESIAKTTEFFNRQFDTLLEFQQSIEETAEDFADGVDLIGKISGIVKDAATPFEFTTTKFGQGLNDALDSVGGGLDGLADTLSDATGFSISANDIPGVGEVRDIVGRLEELTAEANDTPGGFGIGTIGGGFELLISEATEEYDNILEEFDFNDTGMTGHEPLAIQANKHVTPPTEAGKTAAQHYFSTMLAYGKAGIPYLNRLDLNIKGDPYWIGRRNYVGDVASSTPVTLIDETGKSRRWLPEMNTDRGDKTAAPYDAGSVFIAFRYLFPKEYSHYQDDPTLHTGEVERSNMDLTYSGYYMVVKSEHNFAQGKFTTNLMTVKMNTHPNEVIFDDTPPVEQEQANTSSQSAAINNSAEVAAQGNLVDPNANEDIYRGTTAEGRIDFLKDNGYIAGDPPPSNITDTFTTSADYNGVVDPIPMDTGVNIEFELPTPRIDTGGGG